MSGNYYGNGGTIANVFSAPTRRADYDKRYACARRAGLDHATAHMWANVDHGIEAVVKQAIEADYKVWLEDNDA